MILSLIACLALAFRRPCVCFVTNRNHRNVCSHKLMENRVRFGNLVDENFKTAPKLGPGEQLLATQRYVLLLR